MAFEEDEKKHAFFSGDSSARRLMLVIAKNIGDSRIVENIHQHGRDLYRTSKTNSLSNTAVMSNALRSGVLEQRKVDMVSFDAVAKAMGPTWNEKWKGSVASSLRSKGTPMTKQIQRLMLPQSKKMGHSWPTPAPASLFTSVAATTWLFAYCCPTLQRLWCQLLLDLCPGKAWLDACSAICWIDGVGHGLCRVWVFGH